ncbi:nitrite reductase small subunit NirD [Marinobacter nauticus]
MKAPIRWDAVCTVDDLVPESGIAVWTEDGPVAVFYLPHRLPALFAISHHDPISGANVLARGITGDLEGEPVVASPLYKQHFSLRTGQCLEDGGVQVASYPVLLDGEQIRLGVPAKAHKTADQLAGVNQAASTSVSSGATI